MLTRIQKGLVGCAAALVVAFLCVCGAALSQAQRPLQQTGRTDPPRDAPVPFRAGETLDFRAGWELYTSGATLKLAVLERRDFYGRSAWHFQAQATTLNPLRYIFALDDQFDSYSDAADLGSRQYELYIREQAKHEQRIIRMNHEGEPAPPDGAAVRVPAGTRDPLGTLFFLRAVDWQRTPTVQTLVYDGKKLYEVRAQVGQAREIVEVPAGGFTATRVDLRIFERHKELTQVRISVWFALDSARIPVQVEAEMPFGSVRAELARVTTP